ncbi:hypothetical protein [Macrococcus lamae]|uniref:DUF342 domain-containing protein n=1 Tax=Macrococcus lamae TaxID=198484 RepID=A0A4R6BUQ7_9STAP|nr:hypothetical protein [Macrococcus lamae]TDM11965.1 hypothetical protein ERX29_05070 [Macrococcus lamae]
METKLNITEPFVAEGGVFEQINAEVRTDFTSSVETHELTIGTDGDVFVEGRLNAPYISNKGTLDIMDTIETEELANHPDAVIKAGDHVGARIIDNEGTLELGRSLRAESLQSKGSISTGVVDTTTFQSTGTLNIDELNADDLHIKVGPDSSIKFINANNISIKAMREGLIFKDDDAKLVVEEIEGSDVYVENVIADLVRGDQVRIGRNCIIKVVEYTDTYHLDESSEVYELGKISRD